MRCNALALGCSPLDFRGTTALLLLLAFPLLQGCTLIGLTMGSRMQEDQVYEGSQLITIDEGTRLDVGLAGHEEEVSGRFQEHALLPDDAYAALYAERRDPVAQPAMGAPVTVKMREGEDRVGSFQGFIGPMDVLTVRVDEASGRMRTARWEDVQSIMGEAGEPYDHGAMKQQIQRRQVPTRSLIVLDTPRGEQRLPLHEVTHITKPGTKNAAAIGAGIGLVLDIAFFGLLRSSAESSSSISF